MKKLGFALITALSFSVLGVTGCGGGGEAKVIEAPEPAQDDDSPMPGMSEDEYAKAMEESMKNQGN